MSPEIPTTDRPVAIPTPVLHEASAASRLRRPRQFVADALSDLHGSRPTVLRFFKRGLIQRYRNAQLGLLWAVAPSLIVALVITSGQRAQLVGDVPGGIPPAFYGVFGIVVAQTFLDGLNSTRGVFGANQALLARGNLLIEGLIGAALVDAAFNTALRLLVAVGAFAWFGIVPAATAPLAILGLAATLLVGAGLGLMVAPVSVLQRDIANVFSFLPWVLFATTPVFVSPKPGTLMHTAMAGNPLGMLFDSVRTAAYGAPGSVAAALAGLPVGFALVVLGWLVCRFWRPYVVERMV